MIVVEREAMGVGGRGGQREQTTGEEETIKKRRK